MATAPDPVPAKQIEKLLECSFCIETLTNPRTLPCFHSFCDHCLAKYVQVLRNKATENEGKIPETFECPICRTEFHLKENEGVEKIPANYFINNMLELLALQQQSERIKCQSCKADAPAASRCTTCEKYLCEKCLEAHNNFPAFEDHVVFTLEDLAKPENRGKAKEKSRCENHNKVLKFYCESCKVLVCRYCVDVDHTRPEHTWFLLQDVVVKHRDALKTSTAILEKEINEAVQSNENIKQVMNTLMSNADKAKDAIKKHKQELLCEFSKKIEKETADLLDVVDQKYDEANEPLSMQHDDIKIYMEKMKSTLDFAMNIISDGIDEDIVSLREAVEQQAENIGREKPKIMDPVRSGFIAYEGKRSEDILDNLPCCLGKIKAADEWEIKYSALKFSRKLAGKSNSREIWQGLWKGTIPVAIKALRTGTMQPKAFLNEAEIMKKLIHPNILQLFGVCSKGEPICIVTELMAKGSLLEFLRGEGRDALDMRKMIEISTQIAEGMDFLGSRGIVFRNLMARSVMAGAGLVMKIADFGMSRILVEDIFYEEREKNIVPIKWTAPESCLEEKFSIKSDVWSFGILLTEITTFGRIPYPGMTNKEVIIDKVMRAAYRMPKPDNVPEKLYSIMLKCWSTEPKDRPTFKTLIRLLYDFIKTNETN